MDYLAMFPDTFEAVRRYPPAERCYLYEAMGQYAFNQQEPDWPDEDLKWLVWESLKQKVDYLRAYYEKQRLNGLKGGRPRKPTDSDPAPEEPKETHENPPEPNETSKSKSTIRIRTPIKRDREIAPALQERFDRFWAAYPRHTAKQTAVKAFEKINPDEALLEQMLAAIASQKESDQWTRDGGAFIPHPSTWLNQERWNDELPKPVPRQKTVVAQQYEQRDYSQEAADDVPAWMMERWKKMQEGTA